jgi:hypothetical protein
VKELPSTGVESESRQFLANAALGEGMQADAISTGASLQFILNLHACSVNERQAEKAA